MSTPLFVVVTLAETILIGGMFLLYPRFARHGLLFGVYVGEQTSDGDEARAITRGWYRSLTAFFAVALLAALALAMLVPRPPLIGLYPPVLVVGFAVFYVRAYRRARRMAVQTPTAAVAYLGGLPEPSLTLPAIALAAGVVGGLISLVYAAWWYPDLPARVPTHFGPSGAPDAWHAKGFWTVMLMPLLTIVTGGVMGVAAIVTARAKRAVRYPQTEISLRAQVRFRAAVTRLISTVALLVAVMMTLMNVSAIRAAAGVARGIPWPALALTVLTIVIGIGGSLYIGLRYGQGGSRLEREAAQSPLTDGLADNRRWVLGAFYVNRDDPSFMVEDRFGLGYTLNFGNRKAVLLFGGFLLAIAVLIVAAAVFM